MIAICFRIKIKCQEYCYAADSFQSFLENRTDYEVDSAESESQSRVVDNKEIELQSNVPVTLGKKHDRSIKKGDREWQNEEIDVLIELWGKREYWYVFAICCTKAVRKLLTLCCFISDFCPLLLCVGYMQIFSLMVK